MMWQKTFFFFYWKTSNSYWLVREYICENYTFKHPIDPRTVFKTILPESVFATSLLQQILTLNCCKDSLKSIVFGKHANSRLVLEEF